MAEMVEPAFLAVALTGRVDEREVARLADRLEMLLLGREVELFERDRDLLGKADADEARGRDRIAVADEANGLFGIDDLAPLRSLQQRQDRLSYLVGHDWS